MRSTEYLSALLLASASPSHIQRPYSEQSLSGPYGPSAWRPTFDVRRRTASCWRRYGASGMNIDTGLQRLIILHPSRLPDGLIASCSSFVGPRILGHLFPRDPGVLLFSVERCHYWFKQLDLPSTSSGLGLSAAFEC